MISARDDMAGALDLNNQLLQSLAESLRITLGELTLSLADIAKRENVSRSQLDRSPWLVPGFGAFCDASKRPWRCYISTYAKWITIPIEKRRQDWDLMPMRERRKVRSAAKATA
jgi:hypothetical protein